MIFQTYGILKLKVQMEQFSTPTNASLLVETNILKPG